MAQTKKQAPAQAQGQEATQRAPVAQRYTTGQRGPATDARARLLCPDSSDEVLLRAAAFAGFNDPRIDREDIAAKVSSAMWLLADAFDIGSKDATNEKNGALALNRLVSQLVEHACSTGEFYSDKKSEARELATQLQAESGADREPIWGLQSAFERARSFAAQMHLSACRSLIAMESGLVAYRDITGNTWKPRASRSGVPVGAGAGASLDWMD